MDMTKSKKGVSQRMLSGAIAGIIGVVVLFAIVANTIGQVSTQGTSINTTLSGAGLAPLFAGNNSVVILIILAAVLLTVVGVFLSRKLMRG